ncbi:MAG: hypothetical protein MRY74_15960 [Neomegalonema sp.]|nr:hypothetical protein [Neomegalonema sp.]
MVDQEDPKIQAVLEEFERASEADKQSATAGVESLTIWLNQNFGNAADIMSQYGPALLQLLRSIGS